MNQHLSSEQISKYLAGGATADETSHLQECSICGADLARLERQSAIESNAQERAADRLGAALHRDDAIGPCPQRSCIGLSSAARVIS